MHKIKNAKNRRSEVFCLSESYYIKNIRAVQGGSNYDSNNNLAETTYGNGDWEMYSYDSLDRLTEKYYYDTNESVYYYYDPEHRGRFYVFGLKVSLVIIIRKQNTQNRPLCS